MALDVHVFRSSFDGSEGSEAGKFKEPQGVAVNEVTLGSTGDVYVVDAGNNRVEHFSAEGKALKGEFNGSGLLPGEGKAAGSGGLPGEVPTGRFFAPSAIAVDNSTNPLDPSIGDVYVADAGNKAIDKFGPEGTYLGQITKGAGGLPFEEHESHTIDGVAVDREGVVWVYQASREIDSYSNGPINEFLSSRESPFAATSPGFAVDSEDHLYVNRGSKEIAKLNSAGEKLIQAMDAETSTAAAVDPSTGTVYIDNVTTTAAFDAAVGCTAVTPCEPAAPAGSLVERFGSGHLNEGSGMAVNASNKTVYVADTSTDSVRVFPLVALPDSTTGAITNLRAEGSATLNGTVNPNGLPVTSCRFEYGTELPYANSVPCGQTPGEIGSGSSPKAVSANVAGLTLGVYHYRLIASNANGESPGQDRTFVATVRAAITGESVSEVASTSATVRAKLNPGALPAGYHVEYGTTTAYGFATQETSAGAGLEAVGVQVRLSGLQPETVYHARVVASNERGTSFGGDLAFTTAAVVTPSPNLPDGRVYEMVSPVANADGNVDVPKGGNQPAHEITSTFPYRASSSGNAVAYVGDPPASGGIGNVGNGGGNEFLATRDSSGWTAQDIQPSGLTGEYQGFSSDLSLAFLRSGAALTAEVPATCVALYSRVAGDGSYHSAFATTLTECGGPVFAGVSADNSHLLFESRAALTPNAVGGERLNLYDSAGGQLHLVNVLPSGKPDADATFGAAGEAPGRENFGQVISNDGSRIVWTDLNTTISPENPSGSTRLFVRENGDSAAASTAQADAPLGGGGEYWAASSDGSKILFTRAGDLYKYDVNAAVTSDLAPGGKVLGVTAVSADGSYVYFVAEGVLAGNENANKESAREGAANLYVRSGAGTTFIATLSLEDNEFTGPSAAISGRYGDWRAALGMRTAEVTPDGQHLLFMSRQMLTGYNNAGCHNTHSQPAGCPDVFVYDATARQITCASCNPSGAPPVAEGSYLPYSLGEGEVGKTYLLHLISDDGSRVFFNSTEPLVPQDTNGVQDVYEWERNGAGSCRQAPGCIYLISGNLSNDESYLVDASASGNDVFFATRAQLVPQDRNGNVDLYDARVNGGFPQASPECTGSGCQAIPPGPPMFSTPTSVTFDGSGNVPPLPAVSGTPPRRCKRGFVTKHKKCVKIKAKRQTRGKKSRHKRRGSP
jgi:hypothetical protein